MWWERECSGGWCEGGCWEGGSGRCWLLLLLYTELDPRLG